MRYENGGIMAREDREAGTLTDIDYVCGVPDSGTPHAIGYANESGIPFARRVYQIYAHMAALALCPQNQNGAQQGCKNEADSRSMS